MNQIVHKQFELDLISKSIHICFSKPRFGNKLNLGFEK